jgi:hypothetical protein
MIIVTLSQVSIKKIFLQSFTICLNVLLQIVMVTKWLRVRVKIECFFQANHFVDINPCVTVQDLALSRSLGGNVRKLFKKYAKTAKHFKWDYKKQKHCRYLCRKE